MKNYFLVIIFLLLFYSIPLRSFATNTSDVVINEIAWMGTKIEGVESKNWWRYEWLELYNNTQNSISLDGWKIELYRTDLDYTISLKGEIPANGYFLAVASDKIANYDFNYSNLGGKFNNNGQKVVLKNSIGEIIDEIDCFSVGKWFAGDNTTKQTMETLRQAQDENRVWQTSQNPGGTPKFQNSIVLTKISKPTEPTEVTQKTEEKLVEAEPLPTYPDGVIFNEILPSPEGADETEEWIEIYNQNNKEVDLSGWKIEDIEGAKTVFVFLANTKIKAKNYLVLPRPLTKITLNNTSDGLKLSQPNNKVIDSVIFQKAPTGQSYNRTDSGWMWSNTLTPGAANIIFSAQTITKAGPKQNQDSQIDKTNYSAGLAGIYSSLSRNLPGAKDPWFLFLIAIIITIISGLIVILIKWKMRKNP